MTPHATGIENLEDGGSNWNSLERNFFDEKSFAKFCIFKVGSVTQTKKNPNQII